MKKSTLSFGMLVTAAVLVSCGNNNETNGSDAGSAGDLSTATTTTDTMNTGMAGNTGGMAAGPRLTGTDSTFVMEAASGSMMEIEAGRLAEQNATNPRVKAFGAMMVRDHSNASNELRALTSSRSMMLPDSMTAKHKQHLEAMRKMTGSAFDTHYIQMMNTAHNEDINKFQVASNNAQDTAIRGFATRSLPILRMHKDSAQALSKAKL